MPCRKENYIFLEQSVTVDSKEVDALVSQIGEALQLHNNSSRLHGLASSTGGVKPNNNNNNNGGGGSCIRLRNRSLRSSRASPYNPPGSGEQEWDRFKSSWNRKKIDDDDDPHRLLQELILSGNLIKEAVRRLQFSSEPSEHDLNPKHVD